MLNPTEAQTTDSPQLAPAALRSDAKEHQTLVGLDQDVEAAVCEAANQHLQAAIAAVDQQTEALISKVRALLAHTDPDTANAIEARILDQFTDALGQLYHQEDSS
jgi:hypothetical protein